MWTPGVRRDDTPLIADPTITVSIRPWSSPVISVSLTAVLMHLDEARRVRSFSAVAIDASVEGPIPDYQVEHLAEPSSGETVLPGVREVDISVDRSTEASCLPAVRRLNEMRRNASGVFLPLARRGQSAERAGATPLLRRVRGPGGDPGAGVAPEHVDAQHRKNMYEVVVGSTAVALAKRVDEIDSASRGVARDISSQESALRAVIQSPFAIDEFINLKAEDSLDAKIADRTTNLSAVRKSKEILSRRELEPIPVPDLPPKILATLSTMTEQISSVAEDRVRQHIQRRLDARGEQWLRQGVDYIRNNASCPFCSQDMSEVELVRLFREYFSAGYREHVVEIERAINSVEQALGDQALHGVEKRVLENEARIQVWSDLASLAYARILFEPLSATWRRLREIVLEALKRKLANPSAAVVVDAQIEAAMRDYADAAKQIRAQASEIERANAEISQLKKEAAATGEEHLEGELRRFRNMQIRQGPDVNQVCLKLQALRQRKKQLEDEKAKKRAELEQLAKGVMTHYQEAINELLRIFGATFRITGAKPMFAGGKASSTYQIVVNDKILELGDARTPRGTPCFRTALSAGDKGGRKDKSGYYLAVNFQKCDRKCPAPTITAVRFGWLDHSDWMGQKAATGQQARLAPAVESTKLLKIYSP